MTRPIRGVGVISSGPMRRRILMMTRLGSFLMLSCLFLVTLIASFTVLPRRIIVLTRRSRRTFILTTRTLYRTLAPLRLILLLLFFSGWGRHIGNPYSSCLMVRWKDPVLSWRIIRNDLGGSKVMAKRVIADLWPSARPTRKEEFTC